MTPTTQRPAPAPLHPRRILMTADAVGGVWDYALELAAGLSAARIEVVLAIMGPPPDVAKRARAAAVPGLDLVAGPFKLEWMEDPWADVAAAGEWLLALERERGCDLVHLNGYAHGALPFCAPKLVVAHSCVLSWWEAVKGEPAPASWSRYAEAVRDGLRAADRVVAPTRFMLERARHHYGPLPPAQVIRNGRGADAYAPGEKRPFVLCAGRLWDEAKNARALAAVAGRLPWPVKIAGATQEDGRASSDRAGELGGAELLGRLPADALAALYAEAGIYALPARYEPFGLTVLEAALSGCALVLGDVPSLRELWDRAALFVPPDDPDALADALVALAEAPAVRAALGRRAAARARRYGAATMIDGYLTLYSAMMARRARPRPAKEIAPACAS